MAGRDSVEARDVLALVSLVQTELRSPVGVLDGSEVARKKGMIGAVHFGGSKIANSKD